MLGVANNIVIAIVATKNDLVDEPSTAEIVPAGRAKELASSVGAIFIDTSARNDENVNLLFQQVAEQVLYVREKERVNGTGDYDMSSIPVTPGASINEHGSGNGNVGDGQQSSAYQSGLGQQSSAYQSFNIEGEGDKKLPHYEKMAFAKSQKWGSVSEEV